MKIRYSSGAETEFAESALYYLEQSPQSALDFDETIEEAVAIIAEDPNRNPIYETDVRVKVVDTFPFSIFYRVRPNEVQILSIAHQSRRPRFWSDRLD